jgi:hypothetical protein
MVNSLFGNGNRQVYFAKLSLAGALESRKRMMKIVWMEERCGGELKTVLKLRRSHAGPSGEKPVNS